MKILNFQQSGYLDDIFEKYFNKRTKCNHIFMPDSYKISIGLNQYKGNISILILLKELILKFYSKRCLFLFANRNFSSIYCTYHRTSFIQMVCSIFKK
jgi:hypothetical protein